MSGTVAGRSGAEVWSPRSGVQATRCNKSVWPPATGAAGAVVSGRRVRAVTVATGVPAGSVRSIPTAPEAVRRSRARSPVAPVA